MSEIYNYDIEIDTKAILEDISKSSVKTSDLPKVVWHNLPNDDSASTWRFLPYFKMKTFFFKIEKHWDIPGLPSRTVTCPRSFTDPSTGKPYRCAICEEQFRLYKSRSKDEGDKTISDALRSQTNYLCNAIDIEHEEKGIGVLSLPYTIWNSLRTFLESSYHKNFFQVRTGRNIWIKGTYKAGTSVPGKSGKQKRDYTITPLDVSPIEDLSILEGLYDLEKVLGIPTYETTKGWLQKLISGDPNAGEEFLTGNLYLQLDAPKKEETSEDSDTSFPTNTYEHTPELIAKLQAPVSSPTQTTHFLGDVEENTPSTKIGDDGFPVCYSVAFDENNKTCLKCSFADSCETAILKRKRQEKQANQQQNTPDIDPIQAEMLKILNKGK